MPTSRSGPSPLRSGAAAIEEPNAPPTKTSVKTAVWRWAASGAAAARVARTSRERRRAEASVMAIRMRAGEGGRRGGSPFPQDPDAT
jgi:hypothetical protein